MLSRFDSLMLYGQLGVDFFSTFELLYPNMKVRIRVIRIKVSFHIISDNANMIFAFVYGSLYTRYIALR